ncbi:hypothetical protein FACS1894217_10330 [Clostridia bacterium]|nr:hypothetical protein FACS1894217_10330 [Clostridia bacterium]
MDVAGGKPGLTNNAPSGILKTQGGMLMKITDESIAKVPLVESGIVRQSKWGELQQAHKDLLEHVRDDPIGTEAVAYYSLDMELLTRHKGDAGVGMVEPRWISAPHIIIHNHPGGKTFSGQDFLTFMNNDMSLSISAVGNNGNVFVLEKTRFAAFASAMDLFISELRTGTEFDIDKFFRDIDRYGYTYRRGDSNA